LREIKSRFNEVDGMRKLLGSKRVTRRSFSLGSEPLEPRHLLAAMPLISEFMADNETTLQDEDDDYSDWIELYNAGDSSADLDGYYLTDDPSDLTKWRIPQVTLGAGEFLAIFASGRTVIRTLTRCTPISG
jgi:hypothetical protein